MRLKDERNEGTKNRSPVKKLACVETSNAKQAKTKILTASIYRNGTGLFFSPVFNINLEEDTYLNESWNNNMDRRNRLIFANTHIIYY